MKWFVVLLIFFGVILLFLFVVGGTYNSLVAKSAAVDAQWAQVETQYQRRVDLIPNLVETTKGFFQQEQDVVRLVTDARANYVGARTVDDKVAAAGQLESALARLLVVMEAYPQLKSDAAVLKLMDEISGTENRVSVERRRFNEAVRDYNMAIKTFPTNFIAGMFGFTERKYFTAQQGAENAPVVDFNTDK